METQTNRFEIPREDLRRAVGFAAKQLSSKDAEKAMTWCKTATHCAALAWRVDGHDCPGRLGGFDKPHFSPAFSSAFDHQIRSWIMLELGQNLIPNRKGIVLDVIDPTEEPVPAPPPASYEPLHDFYPSENKEQS
jgi:hypothetical protein